MVVCLHRHLHMHTSRQCAAVLPARCNEDYCYRSLFSALAHCHSVAPLLLHVPFQTGPGDSHVGYQQVGVEPPTTVLEGPHGGSS